jgi:hypothetical protein
MMRSGQPKTRQSQIDASRRYDDANTKRLYIKLNVNTDADILRYLDKLPNKQGFIKELIRAAITESAEKAD